MKAKEYRNILNNYKKLYNRGIITKKEYQQNLKELNARIQNTINEVTNTRREVVNAYLHR